MARKTKARPKLSLAAGGNDPWFLITGRFDMPFLLLTLALLAIGLIMMFSASYARAYYDWDNSFYYIARQLTFAVVGVVAMLVASFFNYNKLKPMAWPLYGISIVLILACYLFDPINGARRWIPLGFTSFQPSEIGKFALIVLFGTLMSDQVDKMKDFKLGTLRYLVLFGAMAVCVVFQPHLSATVLLGCITVIMMFVGGSKFSHLVAVGGAGLGGLAVMILTFSTFLADKFSHALVRFTYWLEPFSTNDAGAYQTQQSLLAIGSGGFLGVGLGDSRQKHLYLPEVQNDFVFAIVCEELGFVGATIVVVLFAMLVWRGFTIAMRSKDRFGCLLALGITVQVGIQAILNIAVVTNLVPNTGISLPLFSYGGTSLMMILGELGIVLAVSRQSKYEKD